MNFKPLTPQEEAVIINKGTERPFSGKYWNHHEDGSYHCKRCGGKLFDSSSKFDSHCGWPSFDDAIAGAIKQLPDADGRRTEIVCSRCGGHLGHVFRGEGFTPKNTRHCVNSISIDFEPESDTGKLQKAVFAGGCFWGVEHHFKKAKGVIATRVGYIGGETANPAYKQVCSGTTGHAEAIEVTYDPTQTSYEELAKLFFEIHDPTQIDRQGPDRGTQYRSAVFYANEEQKQITQSLIDELKSKGYNVVTQLQPLGQFWEAEDYHQDYYTKTGHQPYCHIYTRRF